MSYDFNRKTHFKKMKKHQKKKLRTRPVWPRRVVFLFHSGRGGALSKKKKTSSSEVGHKRCLGAELGRCFSSRVVRRKSLLERWKQKTISGGFFSHSRNIYLSGIVFPKRGVGKKQVNENTTQILWGSEDSVFEDTSTQEP